MKFSSTPDISQQITHKPYSISPREASSGDEVEERVGPIIYSGKYLFNKSKFCLEKFIIL
jgi:hypothetical protein